MDVYMNVRVGQLLRKPCKNYKGNFFEPFYQDLLLQLEINQ